MLACFRVSLLMHPFVVLGLLYLKVRRILSKYESALEKAEAERQDQARYLEVPIL